MFSCIFSSFNLLLSLTQRLFISFSISSGLFSFQYQINLFTKFCKELVSNLDNLSTTESICFSEIQNLSSIGHTWVSMSHALLASFALSIHFFTCDTSAFTCSSLFSTFAKEACSMFFQFSIDINFDLNSRLYTEYHI